jgi:hypothetical protein
MSHEQSEHPSVRAVRRAAPGKARARAAGRAVRMSTGGLR